jgi:SNF2 family DNA or RNA helicase
MILDKYILDNLLPYQKDHTINIISILERNKAALDASSTGTGKTYTSIAACAQLKYRPIIICPKSVIYSWQQVCKIFDVKPLFIVNYETIKFEKYYVKGERIKCPYIKYIEDKDKWYYEWDLNSVKDKLIFIFDEVHKCAEFSTENGQLLYAAKQYSLKYDIPMLILSATIADRPERFRLFFYVLNFIAPEDVKRRNLTFGQYMAIMYKWIIRDARPMYKVNTMLYPDRASMMRADTLAIFPETQITATPYSMGAKREAEIEKEYQGIAKELEELKSKSKKDKANILVKVMRAHQRIEILKIPLFVELANDFIENGYSVVIFVNFTQTLEKLSEMLHTKCLLHGQQTQEERDKNINLFQENKSKIVIANIKVGGVGVSLHDLHGGHPRAAILSPTWNAIELMQALGRVHRANGKSKSLQRIIYVANTVEERIADKLKLKLKNINEINNGDIDLTNIIYERDRKKA